MKRTHDPHPNPHHTCTQPPCHPATHHYHHHHPPPHPSRPHPTQPHQQSPCGRSHTNQERRPVTTRDRRTGSCHTGFRPLREDKGYRLLRPVDWQMLTNWEEVWGGGGRAQKACATERHIKQALHSTAPPPTRGAPRSLNTPSAHYFGTGNLPKWASGRHPRPLMVKQP